MCGNIDLHAMQRLSADIRIETIKELTAAGFGHIGGSMSVADVLGVLYGGVMNIRPQDPAWQDRDWMIMSKGHCGPALYAALALRGYFPMEMLQTLNQPGTNLPSHCDRRKTPGVDMTTGSLGQGISTAIGVAVANRMLGKENYTYCILGDGECQEGQIWEGAQFAAHHALDHFIVFIDYNRKQLDGTLESISNPYELGEKFEVFGWHTQTIEGYDIEAICEAVRNAKLTRGKPSAIVLQTYKGIGCSFAEREAFNHYMVVTQEMCDEAVQEIEHRLQNGTYPGGDFSWVN